MAESIQDRYNPSKQLKVNTDGSIDVNSLGQFVIGEFDYIAVTYPTAITEVYTYKVGGVLGTVVATVTVTYTDSTKSVLTSVAKA